MAVGHSQAETPAGPPAHSASLKASAHASAAGSPSAMASGQDPFAESNGAANDAFFTPEDDPADDFLRREREAMTALEIDDAALAAAPKAASNDLLDDFADFASAPAPAAKSPAPACAPALAAPQSQVQSSLDALSALDMQSTAARSPSAHSVGANEAAGASSPQAKPPGSAPESEHVVRMREIRAQRIAAAEVSAEQVRQARRAEAARELEAYKREQSAALEQRRRANREAAAHEDAPEGDDQAGAFAKWNASEPCAPRARGDPLLREDVPWAEVLSIMEAMPKPHRDMSRVLDIVRSLAAETTDDA